MRGRWRWPRRTSSTRASEFGPKELGRIGRRILDVVAPEIAEAAEAARLADLEAHAEPQTRLTMRRLGDGTTRISSRVPDAAATRLATYLEAFTNPRVQREGDGDRPAQPAGDPVVRLAYPSRMGQAFVQLLESLDPTRLPIHGGDATTLVVTIDLDALKADLATADLIGAGLVPGDDLTGDRITAAQARRLACTAKILPVVLGGDSLPLDLGRTRRLFTPAQRKALLVRDRTCRAEGCDVPGTWCEAHHLHPWQHGGRTDLADGVLLCSHHHHRAHEPTGASSDWPTATTASTHADRTRRPQMLRAGRTFRPLWAPSSPTLTRPVRHLDRAGVPLAKRQRSC